MRGRKPSLWRLNVRLGISPHERRLGIIAGEAGPDKDLALELKLRLHRCLRGPAALRLGWVRSAETKTSPQYRAVASESHDLGLTRFDRQGCRTIAGASDIIVTLSTDPRVHRWAEEVAREVGIPSLHGEQTPGAAWVGPPLPTSVARATAARELRPHRCARRCCSTPAPVPRRAAHKDSRSVHPLSLGQNSAKLLREENTSGLLSTVREFSLSAQLTRHHLLVPSHIARFAGPGCARDSRRVSTEIPTIDRQVW